MRKSETYSGVKVTPVTSSASTILTSGTTDSGRTFGLSGGGVGGVDDLDLVISLAMLTVAATDGVVEEDEREREYRGKKGKRRRRRVLYTTYY